MGRCLFLRDVAEASISKTNTPCLDDIESDEEGIVSLNFNHPKLDFDISVKILATNVDEYPAGNNYMLYTDDENAPPLIPQGLQALSSHLNGETIFQVLLRISNVLSDLVDTGSATFDSKPNSKIKPNGSAGGSAEDTDSEEAFFEDILYDELEHNNSTTTKSKSNRSNERDEKIINKAKADLMASKLAGFRVGIWGDITHESIVCISIKVTKLGLSDEAIGAWQLRRQDYLVLMIRFLDGYQDLNEVIQNRTLNGEVEMRVGACSQYKPSADEAFSAFKQNWNSKQDYAATAAKNTGISLEPVFIGRPLNDLLRDRFTKIVKARARYNFNWLSAELFVNKMHGKLHSALEEDEIQQISRTESGSNRLPPIVLADVMEDKAIRSVPLPLIAMQFILRHFVRCTEFCLVCHCKTEENFEALKPYVCSQPLCLYQYMALGFGPSVEWELLSQPYVVDLLISFCYTASFLGRLKEFPQGMNLKVPLLPQFKKGLNRQQQISDGQIYPNIGSAPSLDLRKHVIKFYPEKMGFKFKESTENEEQYQPTAGVWLVVSQRHSEKELHCCIEEVTADIFKLSSPIEVYPLKSATRKSKKAAKDEHGWIEADCYFYDQSFDDLDDRYKSCAITTLLDTLPNVLDMQQWLQKQPKNQNSCLKSWTSNISESAYSLLRWIIASNRSCIMQVGEVSDWAAGNPSDQSTDQGERVYGMDSWIQFRFAQGAPDKEQRFIDCVRREQRETGTQYPTIFAWHGSPVENWHSIIREGLNYDYVLHGRSFGNGVYMSVDANTCCGYARVNGPGIGLDTVEGWTHSTLKISGAISLNEVVNNPAKFRSTSPYYVVHKTDWIQTRYLFVKSKLRHPRSAKPSPQYEQDPQALALNDQKLPIIIPLRALSKSHRPKSPEVTSIKRVKRDHAAGPASRDLHTDARSDLSDEEDRSFLFKGIEKAVDSLSVHDEHKLVTASKALGTCTRSSLKRTYDEFESDFVPGTLDIRDIYFLQPPKDATPVATKALMRYLNEASKTQQSTPLYELGWYINPGLITNMYQWIVELHTFPSSLPLSQDMKMAGIDAVILEMRFTDNFPFDPPFIRVIRPRFLPFAQGGGGHVTEGGAICMELLTNSGWSVAATIESVLLQVRLALCEEDRPARLASSLGVDVASVFKARNNDYSIGEAIAAYKRACYHHGWKVPEGLEEMRLQK